MLLFDSQIEVESDIPKDKFSKEKIIKVIESLTGKEIGPIRIINFDMQSIEYRAKIRKPVLVTPKDLHNIEIPLPALRQAIAGEMALGHNSMNLQEFLEFLHITYLKNKD